MKHSVTPHLGLKYALEDTKGASLDVKLILLKEQLHYAWQRAWRGYDDQDVYNLCFREEDRLLVLMREYRKKNFSAFNSPKGMSILTEDETNAVIDEIITCLEGCNEDARLESICRNPSSHDVKSIYEHSDSYRHRLHELLETWWTQLWI